MLLLEQLTKVLALISALKVKAQLLAVLALEQEALRLVWLPVAWLASEQRPALGLVEWPAAPEAVLPLVALEQLVPVKVAVSI